MRILKTECTEEQQKEDMPQLLQMHSQALLTDMMWEFFGGTIRYQTGINIRLPILSVNPAD